MYYGEKFNALTHLAAGAAALAGAVVLVVLAALNGNPALRPVTTAFDMFATALTGAIRGANLKRGGSLLAFAKVNHTAMSN